MRVRRRWFAALPLLALGAMLAARTSLDHSPVGDASKASAEGEDPLAVFDSAKKAFTEGKYGTCARDLRHLLLLTGQSRLRQVRDAFPAPPPDWNEEPAPPPSFEQLMMMANPTMPVVWSIRKKQSLVSYNLLLSARQSVESLQRDMAMKDLPSELTLLTVGGRKAMLHTQMEGHKYVLHILLEKSGAVLFLDVTEVDRETLVDKIAGAIDLDKVEKAIQS